MPKLSEIIKKRYDPNKLGSDNNNFNMSLIKISEDGKINQISSKKALENIKNTASSIAGKSRNSTKKVSADKLKKSGHHAMFDFRNITVELKLPKIVAMYLNNQIRYNTIEASSRHVKLNPLTKKEEDLYDKYYEIFKERIQKINKNNKYIYLNESKIDDLAKENARYFLSVFTPTNMIYQIPFRNYAYLLYEFKNIDNFLSKEKDKFPKEFLDNFRQVIKYIYAYAEENKLIPRDEIGDIYIKPNKATNLRFLYESNLPADDHFDFGFTLNETASFATVAQLQRHRVLNIRIKKFSKEIYVPGIIKDDPELTEMYLEDMNKILYMYPQGMKTNFIITGIVDDFYGVAQERNCGFAQREIRELLKRSLDKFDKNNLLDKKKYKYPNLICQSPYKRQCTGKCPIMTKKGPDKNALF